MDWTLSQDVKKKKHLHHRWCQNFFTRSPGEHTHTHTHTPGSLLEKQKSLSSLKESGGSSWKSSTEVVLLSCSSCSVFSGCWHVMFEGQFFNEVEVMTALLIGHRRLRFCCPAVQTLNRPHILSHYSPPKEIHLTALKTSFKEKKMCALQPLQSAPNAEHNMKTISAERWEKWWAKEKRRRKIRMIIDGWLKISVVIEKIAANLVKDFHINIP